MSTLTFLNTYSVSQFKTLVSADKVDIVRNPKTGKLFFVAGSVSGSVSDGYKEDPVVSHVQGDESTEPFYMVHKRSSENTVDTL